MENIRNCVANVIKQVAKDADIQYVEYKQNIVTVLIQDENNHFFVHIYPISKGKIEGA